jgi:hypothetical protein
VLSQKLLQFKFILKIFLFPVWVPNSEERKINPKKLYLGSASEDREVALLRRWYARLEIGVCVHGVGTGLEFREWIRDDYITN